MVTWSLGRRFAPKTIASTESGLQWTLLCVLVGLLAAVPFVPALGGPFFWDDTNLIVSNPYVHSLSFVGRWFTHSYFDAGQSAAYGVSNYYRPLSLASFALDWTWGNGNPAAFHATNLLLHVVTTLAIIAALTRWTSRPTGAIIAGLLLAWHPTRAESVAWISGRTDLLVTLFILIACQARALRPKGRHLSLAVEALATLAAYASKETAIVLPIFIALETWILLGRPPLTLRGSLEIARGTASQAAIATGYLLLRSHWLRFTSHAEGDLLSLGLASHVGLVLQTLGRAVELAFLPLTQRGQHGLVTLDSHGTFQVSLPYALAGALSLAGIIALAFWGRSKRPLLTWGCGVFLVCWLPTSNVLPTHLACDLFERFLFLPALGLALAILGALTTVTFEARARLLAALLFTPAVAFGALRSYHRSLDYSDPHRFWAHERRVNPLSSEAPIGLLSSRTTSISVRAALSLLDQCHRSAIARGQMTDAVRCTFEAAVMIADHTPDLDERSLASSVEFFRTVAEQTPQQAMIESPWGTIALDLRRSFSRKALANRRGDALSMLASLASHKGEPNGARLAHQAIAMCPYCPYVPRAAKALAGLGHSEEGLAALELLSRTTRSNKAAMTRIQIQQSAEWLRTAPTLDGPPRLHAEAQALLSVGYFGGAYAILNPHRREFEGVPEVAMVFARIAVNAGDTLAARDTLARFMPPSEVDRRIEDRLRERDLVAP